jgi:hypothetical protein
MRTTQSRLCLSVVLILILTTCLPVSSADTFELKDGRVIDAEITQETDDTVVVSKQGDNFVFAIPKADIVRITQTPPEKTGQQKETFIDSMGRLWSGMVNRFKGGSAPGQEKDEDYRMERYRKEVRSAKEAKKQRAGKQCEEKGTRFRNFRGRCRKCPSSK